MRTASRVETRICQARSPSFLRTTGKNTRFEGVCDILGLGNKTPANDGRNWSRELRTTLSKEITMAIPDQIALQRDPAESPPSRSPFALLAAFLVAIARFLLRLFAKKHPGNFDEEFGSWEMPQYNVTPHSNYPPPKPLMINDCEKGILIYSAVVNNVQACTPMEKAAAMSQADGALLTFFQNHFQCRNPNCIRKEAPLVWMGMHCGTNPTTATGAVMRRFQCRVEL